MYYSYCHSVAIVLELHLSFSQTSDDTIKGEVMWFYNVTANDQSMMSEEN